MDRFQPISLTTSSLGAHLAPSEEVVTLCASVGLYSGPTKSLPHSSGTVYLTSHRLFYIDDKEPHKHSCHLDLDLVKNSEYYAGFLKSSPKVTLGLRSAERDADLPTPSSSSSRSQSNNNSRANLAARINSPAPSPSPRKSTSSLSATQHQDWRLNATVQDVGSSPLPKTTWICRVCAFSNPIDQVRGAGVALKCQLCGVPRDNEEIEADPRAANSHQAVPSPSPSPAPTAAVAGDNDGVSCPVCTFSNHPSMVRCEMCDTPLGSIDVNALQTAARVENGRNKTNGQRVEPSTSTRRKNDFHPVVSLDDALVDDGDEDDDDDYGTALPAEKHDSVRLSFRKGGDKAFYGLLKSTLRMKAWKRSREEGESSMSGAYRNIDGRDPGAVGSSTPNAVSASRRVGIEGIFSTMELQSREENQGMQDAIKDLEALMGQAKKMVEFAESLNAKLTKQEAARAGSQERGESPGAGDEAAATLIRSSLLRLGLPTPALTPDMARDEAEYHRGLARELGGLLYDFNTSGTSNGAVKGPHDQGRGLMGRGEVLASLESSATAKQRAKWRDQGGRGIVALDEAWCIWNRARGVALLSPSTLLAVANTHLPQWTSPPISMRTFRSGLRVLVTPRFDDQRFLERVLSELARRRTEQNKVVGISTMDIARTEEAPLTLIQEMLEAVETGWGRLVRDDGGAGESSSTGTTVWYRDEISSFDWDAWVQSRETVDSIHASQSSSNSSIL